MEALRYIVLAIVLGYFIFALASSRIPALVVLKSLFNPILLVQVLALVIPIAAYWYIQKRFSRKVANETSWVVITLAVLAADIITVSISNDPSEGGGIDLAFPFQILFTALIVWVAASSKELQPKITQGGTF